VAQKFGVHSLDWVSDREYHSNPLWTAESLPALKRAEQKSWIYQTASKVALAPSNLMLAFLLDLQEVQIQMCYRPRKLNQVTRQKRKNQSLKSPSSLHP
jgi:hypothetical protein